MNKMSIRKDDLVVVLSGKDKGKQGKVLRVMPKESKVIVEKVNVVSRHTKPRKQGEEGGILQKEAPIYACKVMRVCPKCDKPTRPAHKVLADGKKGKVMQVSPKEGKVIVENANFVQKHVKPRRMGEAGGIIKAEGAIYACKVQVVCPRCGKPTRVGHKILKDGTKERICKKCGESL